MKVVIAGGGTAGHVNPALALARALSSDEVIFAGTTRGAEATLVPQAGYELEIIEVRGFDRSKPTSIVSTGAQALRATKQASALLRRTNADVVVGMGGYVSLPACLAARRLRLPVVLHEQNIVFGLANRLCRPFARTIGVSFEETLQSAGRKGVLVGNPVAPNIVNIDHDNDRKRAYERFDLDPERKTLLVFGGSQGAQRINEAALGLTSQWAERGDVQILHIAGLLQTETFVEQARSATRGGQAHLSSRGICGRHGPRLRGRRPGSLPGGSDHGGRAWCRRSAVHRRAVSVPPRPSAGAPRPRCWSEREPPSSCRTRTRPLRGSPRSPANCSRMTGV